MVFTTWIGKIWSTIAEFLNFLLGLPDFIMGFLNILPGEIQVILLSAIGILSILLVYRFIK